MSIDLQRRDPWNGDDKSYTGITYYGYAAAGSPEVDWLWTIKRRRIENGISIIEYPFITGITSSNGNPSIFLNNLVYIKMSGLRWDLRTSYTYSANPDKNLINYGIWRDDKIWLDSDTWVDFPI